MDDLDTKLSEAELAEVWDLLRSLADAGTTVLAVCRTAPEGCVTVSTVRTDEDAPSPRAESRTEEDADALA